MNFEGETALADMATQGAVEAIAVIGIGCRFPGGVDSAESYWQFLRDKRCGIVRIPENRWNLDAFYDPDPDAHSRSYSEVGGFMSNDVFGFDPAFFDMSPREVTAMDPQQRIALQVAFEAAQDACVTIEDLRKARTGVFLGISTVDFATLQRQGRTAGADIFAGTGAAFSIAANRISHRFGLNGPSLAIDTACSSALVSIDQAVRHLSMGTCDMAFAGGVNCMLDPGPFVAFSGANMLSKTGGIYTFDERADGFLRGEGCGLVLLKRLDQAVADGDRIYGVIRQSMVNQDGFTSTLTAPSGDAQQAMLQDLMDKAGIDPCDVDYVEAHGTGTPVGDPIEAAAIGRVMGMHARSRPLYIGSYKPNLGHLESAAGVAGFIKALLIAERGMVLPNRNFDAPNPDIPFDALNMEVPTEAAALDKGVLPTITAVNSFGFGGTNASVLIERWNEPRRSPQRTVKALTPDIPLVAPLSAQSPEVLGMWATQIADALDTGGSLAQTPLDEVIDHLQSQRDAFSHRAALIVPPRREALQDALRALAAEDEAQDGESPANIVTGRAAQRQLAMIFSGQGGQWWAMARRLLQEDKEFRGAVDRVDAVLQPIVGWSTVEEMLKDEAVSRINTAEVTQASIFATQVALFDRWVSAGLRPDLLLGHSFGEVAAACSAGYIGLEDAARLIALRGQIPQRCTRKGAMAAVGLTVDQLKPLLADFDKVIVGAFNGPVAQTISGDEEDVVRAMEEISAAYPDVLVRRMQMDFAWHSQLLDDVEDWFRSELGSVEVREGSIPMVSTVTGMIETQFDEDYWWENLRQPVSFTRGISLSLDLGIDAFLELGPHRTLTPLARGIAQDKGVNAVSVTSLDRKGDDFETLAHAEAELFVAGVRFDRPRLGNPLVAMPRMPWNNQQLKELAEETEAFLFDPVPHPLLGRRDFSSRPSWSSEVSLKSFKYLVDHTVGDDVLFPAVGFIEIMGAALRDYYGDGPVELRDFRLHEATSISSDDIVMFATNLDPVTNRLSIHTMHRGFDRGWHLRAVAYGFRHDYELEPLSGELAEPDMASVDKIEFYRLAERHGLQYGPAFQLLDELHANDKRVTGRLDASAHSDPRYFAFPGLLDSALQASIAMSAIDDNVWKPGVPLPPADEDKAEYRMRLPVGLRKVFLKAPLTEAILVKAEEGFSPSKVRIRIYSPEGEALLVMEDLESRFVGTIKAGGRTAGGSSQSLVFQEHFERQDALPDCDADAMHWLVVGSGADRLARIAGQLEKRGDHVAHSDPEPFLAMDVDAVKARIADLIEAASGKCGLLFCASDPDALADRPSGEDLFGTVSKNSRQLMSIAQAFERLASETGSMPHLAILTSRSRAVAGDEPLDMLGVSDSSMIGMGRSIASELQHPDVRLIDADEVAFAEGDAIVAALIEETAEREFVIRAEQRFVPRLESRPLKDIAAASRPLDKAKEETNFGVTMTAAGSIDNIVLREMTTPECAPEEILIEVAAVGLNFRDIMAATSILPGELEGDEAYWRNLGLEFAGVVKGVGSAVRDLAPGDKVMGMGKGFLRRFAKIHAGAVMRLPADADLKEAATMPVAFLTAHYALNQVGHLDEDETVLVHLASGGVGLAAIQVANDLGATVFGTAGSDKKRAFVAGLGAKAVMNSRSLEFAEEVLAKTGGRGVDVVLNALSGQGIDKSLECLAPFGRMVEIGKRDLADDKPIGLGSLYRNNAYSVIDLSTLPVDKPRLFAKLLKQVEAKVANGDYKALPATYFPASETSNAMRLLFKAQHIGKVVVSFDEPVVDVDVDLVKPIMLSGDGSYLVTGGLRGFGVVVADWLSQQGAGTVILANRSGVADEDAAAAIAEMEKRGTNVVTASLDVSDGASIEALFERLTTLAHPLRGVIHGAAVIEDAFVSQMDADKLDRVLRPKVAGAQDLHNAALDRGIVLDFFVNMSSIAEVVGSAGQANYTAANSVLNALAEYRRGQGLAATSVAWGMIAGSGFAAQSEALTNYLESAGIRPVQDTDAASALGILLRGADANLAYANLDWQAIGRVNSGMLENPRVKLMVSEIPGGRSRLQQELMQLPRDRWEALLADHIRGDIAKVLKVDASAIADDRKLSELGLDSLSAFELKNRIETHVEVEIPIAQFIQAPTIERLAVLVASSLERKIDLALSKEAQVDADSAEGGAKADFRPMPRQLEALALPTRPMSTAAALHDDQVFATAIVPDHLTLQDLNERLKQLAAQDSSLCMAARIVAGEPVCERAAVPTVRLLQPDEELAPITGTGALWRFGVTDGKAGGQVLHVRAHRAVADSVSPYLVAAALCADDDSDGGVTTHTDDETCADGDGVHSPGSMGYRRALAYWHEVLREAPSKADIPGRKRSPAPARLGRNRGPMGFLTATLSPAPAQLDERGQGRLLCAFVRTLEESYALHGIVVDHWFSDRQTEGGGRITGAFDSFYPVVVPSLPDDELALEAELKRSREQAHPHRSVDTPALESELHGWLRERDIALRQFGYAFVDADQAARLAPLSSPLDAVAMTPQEIQLAAACDTSGLRVRLGVDLDVLSQADANRLFDELVLNAQRLFASADMQATDRQWLVKDWPEIAIEEEDEQEPARSPLADLPNFEREVPFTPVHDYFMRVADHPEASALARSIFVIGKEFIVRPQMELDRLSHAIATIVSRHEAIRHRFVKYEDRYLAYLEANPSLENYLVIETVADEETARIRAREVVEEAMEPTAPMLRVTLLRFGEGDLVIAKAHHLVFDGYSLGLVMDELVKAYVGLPLPEVEMDLDTFNSDYLRIGDAEAEATRRAFLEEIYSDAPPYPNLGRKAKGLEPNHWLIDGGPARDIFRIMPSDKAKLLHNRAKSAGTTVSQMVMAAFAKAICVIGDVDEVIMEATHSMRVSRRLENYVNNVVSGVLLRIGASSETPLEDVANAVARGMDRGMENAWQGNVLFTPLHDDLIAAGSYASRFLTGDVTSNKWTQDTASAPLQRVNTDGDVSMGMYTITNLPPQKSQRASLVELALRCYLVDDGGLGIAFNCDSLGMDEDEAVAFLDYVEAELNC